MRLLLVILMLLPVAATADDFFIDSKVAAVTLYPDSGTVTRTARFSIPEGRHLLVISDIPNTAIFESLSAKIDGAVLGGVRYREDDVPPRDIAPKPEVEAAKSRVETIERQIEAVRDQAARARLASDAAAIRIGFLNQLGRGEGMADAGMDSLRALSKMVGEHALEARQSALEAEIDARNTERQLVDLNEELETARQALAALDLENHDRVQLVLHVAADKPVDGGLTVEYLVDYSVLGWAPVYEFRLTRGDAPSLEIQRDVMIFQDTGENWTDVQLTLSTVEPVGQIAPSKVFQKPLRVGEPSPAPAPSRMVGAEADMAAPVVEAPAIIEESNGALFGVDLNGLSVTYHFGEPVSLTSGADVVRLTLDSVNLPAEVFALANPARDRTAFLMARFTNSSGEQLLPSGFAGRHLDGLFSGTSAFDGLPAGGEDELSFGAIDGLRLDHAVLNQNSGDRGFISKSNQQSQREEFVVTNLTAEDWTVRMLGAAAYSQQDDLKIDWSAIPPPSETDVDKRRGILAWEFDLRGGEDQTIRLDTTMTWPEGLVLR